MTSYTQSGTGASLTDQQIAGGTYGAGTFFIQSGTGQQMTQDQIKASLGSTSTPTPTPTQTQTQTVGGLPAVNPNQVNQTTGGYQAQPTVSTIGNPANAPTPTATGYTPPAADAPSVADQFNTSLSTTLAAQTKALQDALSQQTASYQTKIDNLNSQNADFKQLESMGLANENSLVQNEAADKQQALQQEKEQFDQNYTARQGLVGQLQTLLTSGQSIIEGMRNTTGLASIMNPRLSQTMTDVQAQAGVITAALSAYDSQIGLAQNQLTSSLNAITSIYGDQLKYWDSVVNFYDSQVKGNDAKVASLTSEQKQYIDASIQTAKDALTQTQATTAALQKAMLDPNTALSYARAGVKLTDSPAQIQTKVAQQAYADELTKMNKDYADNGYSSTYVAGSAPLTVTDSQGVSHTYYATTKPGDTPSPPGSTGGVIVDGKMTTTADHITAAKAQLTASASQGAEADGKYADPNVYLKLFTDWIAAKGTEKGFLSHFPYSTYINPANTWLTDSMTQVANGGADGEQTP